MAEQLSEKDEILDEIRESLGQLCRGRRGGLGRFGR